MTAANLWSSCKNLFAVVFSKRPFRTEALEKGLTWTRGSSTLQRLTWLQLWSSQSQHGDVCVEHKGDCALASHRRTGRTSEQIWERTCWLQAANNGAARRAVQSHSTSGRACYCSWQLARPHSAGIWYFWKHGCFICWSNRFIFYKQLTRTQIMNPILVWPILLGLAVGIRKTLK